MIRVGSRFAGPACCAGLQALQSNFNIVPPSDQAGIGVVATS